MNNYALLPKQQQAIFYLMHPLARGVSEILYGGAAGGGKTALEMLWLNAMVHKHPGTRWLLGRGRIVDLKATTLNTYFDICRKFNLDAGRYRAQHSCIDFRNGSQILFGDLKFYPSDPEYSRFAGLEITGGVADEANQITTKCKSILISRMRWKITDALTPKLLMGTNPDVGFVFEEFYSPWRKGKLPPHRAFIQALPRDNPHLHKSYLKNLDNLPTNDRARLRDGLWEFNGNPDWLIDGYDKIKNMLNPPPRARGHRKYITCDPARFGGDEAVILVWDDWHIIEIAAFKKSSVPKIVEQITEFRRTYQIPISNIAVDSNGVGGGVADYLPGCFNFVGNNTPFFVDGQKELYGDRQDQCAFHLAEKINSGEVGVSIPNRYSDGPTAYPEAIAREMVCLSKKPYTNGKLRLIDKAAQKIMLNGDSPDYLDAMIIRSVFDLAPQQKIITPAFGVFR